MSASRAKLPSPIDTERTQLERPERHFLARLERRVRYRARMLPGVSAEACLFADIGFDPLSVGCQSYEATDFVQRRPQISIGAALLLWQIGVVGERYARFGVDVHLPGVERLVSTLCERYPEDHKVVAYEASPYPTLKPIIDRCRLRDLVRARLSPISTLFVPPVES